MYFNHVWQGQKDQMVYREGDEMGLQLKSHSVAERIKLLCWIAQGCQRMQRDRGTKRMSLLQYPNESEVQDSSFSIGVFALRSSISVVVASSQ